MHLQLLSTLSPEHLAELECVDEQLTMILLMADHQCHPKNSDPWSLELNQAYLHHRLWTITLYAHRNDRDMSDILKSIRIRLWPSPEDDEDNHRSFSANLHQAQKHLCQVKHEADQLWKKHLEAILNEAKATNNHKKSSALTYLIRAEQSH